MWLGCARAVWPVSAESMSWLRTFSGRMLIRAVVAINFSILTFAMLSAWGSRVYEFMARYLVKIIVWWLWASSLLLPVLLILAAVQRRRATRLAAHATKSLFAEPLLLLRRLFAFAA